MKITLLHGENEVAARSRFNELIDKAKANGFEIIRDGFASSSLFSDKSLYISENPKKLEKKINGNLLVLCDSIASATLLKSLPKETTGVTDFVVEKFDVPKKIFAFLDRLSLKSFNEVIETQPVELIFAMMGRHLRDLYWVAADPKTLTYPEWRLAKLRNQANKFTIEKLKKIISLLAEIDIKAKIGERDLTTSLDLLLASELE